MRYLVDADFLIDATIGRPDAVQTLEHLSSDGLAIRIIAVAEVYEGAFGTPQPEATLAAFREFLASYAILPVTDSIAERFARLRATLRRQGQLIPDMDLLIAATALDAELTLLTRNIRHFERIAGLTLYQPSEPPRYWHPASAVSDPAGFRRMSGRTVISRHFRPPFCPRLPPHIGLTTHDFVTASTGAGRGGRGLFRGCCRRRRGGRRTVPGRSRSRRGAACRA